MDPVPSQNKVPAKTAQPGPEFEALAVMNLVLQHLNRSQGVGFAG